MCCVTGLSIVSVQCCVLHMNLCLAKSLTATIWRDVNSMSESVQGVGTQDVLQELNALTGHMGLQWNGWLQPCSDNPQQKVSGQPKPSGRAAKWALDHLTAIVEVAYPAGDASTEDKRQRMLTLAKECQDVLQDVAMQDWAPRTGMFWVQVHQRDMCAATQHTESHPTSGVEIRHQGLIQAILSVPDDTSGGRRLKRSTVLALQSAECRLLPSSWVRLGQACWRPEVAPDPAEDLRRAQLPANLRGFAMAWKHAHDRLGKGNGHGGYYVHDLMHHVGWLIEHAESRGLAGLGCLSNSVLEHWHQVNGKPAFNNVHIMSQAALACVARDHTRGLGQHGPGTPKFIQSNPGQMILLVQLTKSIGARLCPGCLRLPNQCPGTPLCLQGRTPKRPKFVGWRRVTRQKTLLPRADPGETRTVGNAGLYADVLEETQNQLTHIRPRAEQEHIEALAGSYVPAHMRLTSNNKTLRFRLAPGCHVSAHRDTPPLHAPDSDSIPSQCSGSCPVCVGQKGRVGDLPCAVLGHCGRPGCCDHNLCWHRVVSMCSVFRNAWLARLPCGTCRSTSLAENKSKGPITDWIKCLSDHELVKWRTHIIAALSEMRPEGLLLAAETGKALQPGPPVTAAALQHQISAQQGKGKRFTNQKAGQLKELLHRVLRNGCDLTQTRDLCVTPQVAAVPNGPGTA